MAGFILMEEMDSYLWKVIRDTGEVLGQVDTLAAEAMEWELKRQGATIQWIGRNDLKERKHVRNLISQHQNKVSESNRCNQLSVGV